MNPRAKPAATIAAIAAAAIALAMATGCGEKSESSGSHSTQKLTLALDWLPNADHAGIYEAIDGGYFRDAGLDVSAEVPSDPSAPIKEVAAGHADLAISYEPEVMLARDQGLPVTAIAAIVPRPLTSLISLPAAGIARVSDLKGKTVATAGIPYQQAYLEAILKRAHLALGDLNVVDVQQGLLPALVSKRADAILGGFSNVEGVDLAQRGLHPRVVPVDRLGIPTYDELVLVANSNDLKAEARPFELFIAALDRATQAAAADPVTATAAVLHAGHGLDPKVTRAQVNRTVPLLAQKGTGHPFGYMDPRQWTTFAHFMADNGLIKVLPAASEILDDDLLPSRAP